MDLQVQASESGARAAAFGDSLAGASADALAGLAADAIFSFDPQLRVLSCNRAFRETFCQPAGAAAAGTTFCRLIECLHVDDGGACGTAPACAFCGWLRVAAGAGRGQPSEHECRVVTRSGQAYDLQLRSARDGDQWFCRAKDCYEAKRLRVLERAFFHDVMNQAVGIKGLSDLADVTDPAQMAEYMSLIQGCAARMVDEILWLRTLRGAEQGSLSPCVTPIAAGELLDEVACRFQEDAAARHVQVVLACEGGWVVETDRELLRLAVGSLVLNAIEACKRGDKVCVSGAANGESAEFRVSSAQPLSDDVRAQLFHRSFSTKGAGRGVGTYGTKLVVERYLGGKVWYEPRAEAGAVFGLTVPLVWPQPRAIS